MPLNVFEPRYLAMVDDALGAGRIFADPPRSTERLRSDGECPSCAKWVAWVG